MGGPYHLGEETINGITIKVQLEGRRGKQNIGIYVNMEQDSGFNRLSRTIGLTEAIDSTKQIVAAVGDQFIRDIAPLIKEGKPRAEPSTTNGYIELYFDINDISIETLKSTTTHVLAAAKATLENGTIAAREKADGNDIAHNVLAVLQMHNIPLSASLIDELEKAIQKGEAHQRF